MIYLLWRDGLHPCEQQQGQSVLVVERSCLHGYQNPRISLSLRDTDTFAPLRPQDVGENGPRDLVRSRDMLQAMDVFLRIFWL